ncbi:MAG: cytochrome c oxidase subunit 4 [Ktedonobacteraceae bacterium]
MAEEQNQNQQGQQQPDKGLASKGVQEHALQPSTSYWPFALAVALSILLLGVITGPVVLVVGAVLTAAAVIAWGLERR